MKLIVIALVSLLAGCVTGASQSQLNTAMEKANLAAANCPVQAMSPEVQVGWETVKNLSEKNCLNTLKIDNPTPEQLQESFSCWENNVSDNVKPVTKQKKALETYLANLRKLNKDSQSGVLSRENFLPLAQPLWNEYVQKEVSYFRMTQCQNATLQQHVMPVYHNKGILAEFMAKRSEIALKVDEGELSPQKADVEIQKAFAELGKAEQGANAALQAQNAQAWRDYSKQLQTYSSELNKAEIERQKAIRDSGPTNTNCQMVGNQMQCTTW